MAAISMVMAEVSEYFVVHLTPEHHPISYKVFLGLKYPKTKKKYLFGAFKKTQ